MIDIYRYTPNAKQTNALNPSLSFLDFEQSLDHTAVQLDILETQLHIPTDFIHQALDPDERPRIEKRGEWTFLLIHIPFSNTYVERLDDQVKFRTIPFTMLLKQDCFVVICNEDHHYKRAFFEQQALQQIQQGIHPAWAILQHCAQSYVELVKQLEKHIVQAEDELSRSYRNQELYTLLYLNESLLYITTSLKQLLHILHHDNVARLWIHTEQERDLYQHCLIEFDQVAAVAEINQLNLNNVMDAYGNVIQNNVSHVVKLLTAVTIVLSVPTLIASVYGMNVPLPFQEAEHAFSYLIIVMLLSSGLIAYIFYKKQYF